MLAARLYLGAGIGLFFVGVIKRKIGIAELEKPLTKKELPSASFPAALFIMTIGTYFVSSESSDSTIKKSSP